MKEEENNLFVVIEIIKGYNAEKIELAKMMREMGDKDYYLHSEVSKRLKEVDSKLLAFTTTKTDKQLLTNEPSIDQ